MRRIVIELEGAKVATLRGQCRYLGLQVRVDDTAAQLREALTAYYQTHTQWVNLSDRIFARLTDPAHPNRGFRLNHTQDTVEVIQHIICKFLYSRLAKTRHIDREGRGPKITAPNDELWQLIDAHGPDCTLIRAIITAKDGSVSIGTASTLRAAQSVFPDVAAIVDAWEEWKKQDGN